MKSVILAAGMGKRLNPTIGNIPKGLIKIGKKTLLERSLEILFKNRIKEVIIVIGYLGSMIKDKLGNSYSGVKIKYIWNKEYTNSGSMYSLSKAKDIIDDDVILLESDLSSVTRGYAYL